MGNNEEINEFKKKFSEYFHAEVRPKLEQFEQIRKKYLMIFQTTLVVCLILSGLIVLLTKQIANGDILGFAVVPIILATITFGFLKTQVERKIKENVMPVLMGAFGDFHWTQTKMIEDYEIRSSMLIGSNYDIRKDDDCFYGSYKGVNLVINETELAYETRDSKGHRQEVTVFDGLIIQLDMNKNFNSHTIIIKDSLIKTVAGNLKRVTLEDPEFEKFFDVYSNDQIESRYLLTTAFMERFKNLMLVFKTKAIKCSFKDKKVLLALDLRKDMFKLGGLFTPATDTKQYEELFKQIASIFEMINVLKLDLKIGM